MNTTTTPQWFQKTMLLPRLFAIACLMCMAFTANCFAEDILQQHCQLLVVTTNDWNEKQGSLQLYERDHSDEVWRPYGESIPVVIGKKGMAWGIGLHTADMDVDSFKAEGDLKSPAGIFAIGTAFGFASQEEMNHLKIEYTPLDEYTEAVDDPNSRYYNQIISRREVLVDWNSSEIMGTEGLYSIGFMVNHNYPKPVPGAGSAIFFHIWRNEDSGTAGCTAMSENNLEKVLLWLTRNKNPVLVQLPHAAYTELQNAWHLPSRR